MDLVLQTGGSTSVLLVFFFVCLSTSLSLYLHSTCTAMVSVLLPCELVAVHLYSPPSCPVVSSVAVHSMKTSRVVGWMREWREFRYCRSLLGRQIACDDHMATPAWDVLQEASPARLTHVSQPGLEEVLREAGRLLRPAVALAVGS